MRFREAERVELKQSTAELKQALEDLCAFTNSDPGIYAENFILRNIRKSAWINPQTGRREEKYELPYLAIREAIANAVAHRDYRIGSHIDIAIFDDRVEVWSPGELPLGIKMEDLFKKHISVLRNPAIAEILFLAGYIERWGTGINKMNRLMQEQGLPIPEYEEISGSFVIAFRRKVIGSKVKLGTNVVPSLSQVGEQVDEQVTEQVTEQVQKLLSVCGKEILSAKELMTNLGLSHRPTFLYTYLKPAIEKNLVKMTIPDKPQSSKQRYVITEKGSRVLKAGKNEK